MRSTRVRRRRRGRPAASARRRSAGPRPVASAPAASGCGPHERFEDAILTAIRRLRKGDLSARVRSFGDGKRALIAEELNDLIAAHARRIEEIKRLSRVVGKEGLLRERALIGPDLGAWAESVQAINSLIEDLTQPTREVGRVIGAVARGDLSRTMPLTIDGRPLRGTFLSIATMVNSMVRQLGSFSSEVSRVAREVGTEGKLGGQAEVKEAAGVWKELTDNVNLMASNLTSQVRNIAEVTTAVANGDLSRKITVEVRGEILQLKDTINTMVDQLRGFAAEVTRVAREVGTEGKLGGQALVPGVGGVWKDLTDNVNSMAANLTDQVRNIAAVTTAVAEGDLSKQITVDVKGEMLDLKDTINTMVAQLRGFAAEVTRVAREVGTEGKLGGQAKVKDVAGVWKDLTDNVNSMASNLTSQVRNIAEVTTAVATGDLSRKITVEVKGEILQLKKTINTMVDQLNSFASEVTRVAREVGTDGKLGGQARVRGVAGVWKDLTDNVNFMASNLTSQVRNIKDVTKAIARGDLSRKITVKVKGEVLDLKDTINTMVDQLNAFASETTRVAREVGTEGKLGGQAKVKGVAGVWKDLTNNVNTMARNLRDQVRNIAQVNRAIAKGDLSKKITIQARGEILQLKGTINETIDLLNAFASEVTRVAREVGTEGKLGGQAKVKGVAGVWKGLTDNVNSMASNLTGQVRNIAGVTKAVARGDLSEKITVDVKGEMLDLKNTINTMVDQLNSFASEVTRVAREVGTEGKLGGQAKVKGVAGVWKDLTDNVNSMASNLTGQVRNIAEVTTAVATGDLSKKITVEVAGEILQLKNTINTMVDQLRSFASEVTRVAREVGFEGKLGGQAEVPGVAGVWKDLTNSVNFMAGNLTDQVRNIADITTAVANGDLSRKITVEVRGEILQLKNTVNKMVDQLKAFASEVTRVAREVGTEGKLGGQAEVKGVAGVWKDLTDSVNFMASNLTGQVRNIAEVTTAVATGDLSKKITVEVAGEILQLKNTINTMVDQLRSFASEVTRVAREVGFEGKLGGQADVKGVAGVWKDLTNNVNFMAGNLTNQVRNIADVTTAVANGDLSRKITVEVRGEILQLKNTVNKMVDQLKAFASEVTRVAREVGTEGKLGGQAKVKGVAGVWKDLTDSVNFMASNLTDQVRNIADVTTAVAKGNLSKKITVDVKGEILELKNTVNTMVDQLNAFAAEVTRVAREVGTEGKLGGQAQVKGVAGVWEDLTDNVNLMASNLTGQVRNIAAVTTAVARGDLSKKITVRVHGEIAELKDTINTMVDQLNSFASEVTRVAREVGTEGKLGGQAKVKDVAGVWKDLTDNVNQMAFNLTTQVRRIARVVTAVAAGDLRKKLPLEARGEIADLADTINDMIDTLATFAEQVTGVAREVGVEGKLGGQARVPGATGTWRDLTDNVNQLAANLTSQVRAIADVATAVTKGDLTRSITVAAHGEVAALKDNINEMIRNLRETTRKNAEQDWLKTNLAKFTRMLQGERDLAAASQRVLSELVPLVSAQLGVFYFKEPATESQPAYFRLLATYGYYGKKIMDRVEMGEGILGRAASEKKRILIDEETGRYMRLSWAVAEGEPAHIIAFPLLFEGEANGVIELASVHRFSEIHLALIDQLADSIGIVVNTIAATRRTETLLDQSQSLARELQSRQEELQKTNVDLQDKARQIEIARRSLEDKAAQLALTSKYKSQFLANMSHELRTPLNSLLILARSLAENPDRNLSPKQVQFANTIQSAGRELLSLINDILDLAKIESGTIAVDLADANLSEIAQNLEGRFRMMAQEKRLRFQVELAPDLPKTVYTDAKRLQQIVQNLLSNAIKFTDRGSVTMRIGVASGGWSVDHPTLNRAKRVVAISVADTGIGIPRDKHRIIFEAFQQVDMTTSRKYGGTGLGLSISRELAALLGGQIKVQSEPGKGSAFTLFLPEAYVESKVPASVRADVPVEAAEAAPPVRELSEEEEPAVPAVPEAVRHALPDDRERIGEGEDVLLVIEGDPSAAREMRELAHRVGFKTLISIGEDSSFKLARQFKVSGIMLDLVLPDSDGWTILDRLKHDPAQRHVPVCVLSPRRADHERALRQGAFCHMTSPARPEALERALRSLKEYVHRDTRRVLVVERDPRRREEILHTLGNGKVKADTVATGREALEAIRGGRYDCVIVDPSLGDIRAADLLAQLHRDPSTKETPVVVYDSRGLGPEERARLLREEQTGVVLEAESPADILDETTLFLHRPASELADEQRRMLEDSRRNDRALAGKSVLIVDDDLRNIFALSSVLETYRMNVSYAENGRDALKAMVTRPPDVVLMDIMMPDMSGYQVMREIRKIERFRDLPILALTAKAMREDREKCIAAGASDYVPKPVDTEHLLSVLRGWLSRRR